jgi:hypothetical protein
MRALGEEYQVWRLAEPIVTLFRMYIYERAFYSSLRFPQWEQP